MTDDSELDYLRTLIRAIHSTNEFTGETVASVNTVTKAVTLTAQAGTLDQYEDMNLVVESGDNAGTEYRIVSNTNATPTVLTVLQAIPADLATDVVGVWSGATIKHFSEKKNINYISDTNRVLVYPGTLLSTFENTYTKRYMIRCSQTTEITSTTCLTNIMAGIVKLNKRIAITAYTKPSILMNIRLVQGSRSYENPKTKRWDTNIYIIVQWATT